MGSDVGTGVTTRAERDLAARLAAVPQELVFGDDQPAAIVDRYYAPDFEQDHDGIRFDRERVIQHARPARKNVVSLRTEVHEVLVSGDRFAARYTLHTVLRRGATLADEIYLFGRLAADGRICRIDSTTRKAPQGADQR
jgi:SnoaL-like domain